MHGAAHQQIAADLAAGRLGQRLVDAQLVEARAAFEVEFVQEVLTTLPVVVMKSLFRASSRFVR